MTAALTQPLAREDRSPRMLEIQHYQILPRIESFHAERQGERKFLYVVENRDIQYVCY